MDSSTRAVVLHVAERLSKTTDDFDSAVDQAGYEVEHCETVYGALACLVRPAGRPISAVIVCLDSLEPSELEFFTLAAAHAPSIPVYVYGRSANGQRQQRAISCGAKSEITADHIAAVLAAVAQDRPAESSGTDVRQGSTADVGRSPAKGGLAHRSTRVPTPWQPAAGRPQRVPPGGRKAREQAIAGRSAKAGGPHSAFGEPLVSRQEVDALLGEVLPPDEVG